ncbi:MAG: tryptophan synthase subunit alpha [Verrucomicrobiota bacterium]|jgi:tryptophan synthase alpha chain|nr:MAG: tryptophan synthase subunit alpha [Verrucomicrobiota bacterium]
MSRISTAFATAKSQNRSAFIAYLCAGDPDFDTSLAACHALIDAGVDILELGVPFSDPLADGITNQLAAQRALESGMSASRVFELVCKIREKSQVPIVFYTYYNLVFSNGVEAYIKKAKQAGVDGMLTLDLPPEEASEVSKASTANGLDCVFIVAPTTPAERLAIIGKVATGFIYYVSREGVTGVRDQVAVGIADAVERIKSVIKLPVAVGFGIATRAHVAEVAALAEGVIVGSALVNVIKDNLDQRSTIGAKLKLKASDLILGTVRK